jgi:hypothetical protein
MERKYYDLTKGQRMTFLSQKYTFNKEVNNICTSILMEKELDFEVLKKAIEKEYERNDSLRLRVLKVDGEMKQYFEEQEKPTIEYLDFRGKTKEEMEEKLYKIASKSISVFGKPMSKVYLMHSCDGKCGICFLVSHLLFDFWGVSVFYVDVLKIYEAMIKGEDMPKPLNPYEDLLVEELNYKNTERYIKDLEYFNKMLDEGEPVYNSINGYSVLEKYRKKKKNPNLGYASEFSVFQKGKHEDIPFPKELTERIESYCTTNKVTMQSILFLAYRSYISKINKNEPDVSLTFIIAGRGTLKEKNTGGTRATFLPLRTIMEKDVVFKEACEIIDKKTTELYRHASFDPMELLAMRKSKFSAPALSDYEGAVFSFQPERLVGPDGSRFEIKWYGNGISPAIFFLTIMDGGNSVGFNFNYEYQLHNVPYETIEKINAYMIKAIEAGISKEGTTIGDLLEIE